MEPSYFAFITHIRTEFPECRRLEREFRADQHVVKLVQEASRTNKSPMELSSDERSALMFTEGALDTIELSRITYERLDVDPRLRQLSRDMLSCLNRIGLLCAWVPNAAAIVARAEGRYVGYFWHHWRHYIMKRRELHEGRARVFAPAEHLVYLVSRAMLAQPLPDDHPASAADVAYWQALKDQVQPMERYYSSQSG